jgi:hypothetical protein
MIHRWGAEDAEKGTLDKKSSPLCELCGEYSLLTIGTIGTFGPIEGEVCFPAQLR